jgi:molybdate transport system ATP-binding protein
MSVLKTDIALQRTGFALEIDCEIDTQITGIFGPSGAGKTTFLHALAGLETPDRGSIQIADRVVFHSQKDINLPPEKKECRYCIPGRQAISSFECDSKS